MFVDATKKIIPKAAFIGIDTFKMPILKLIAIVHNVNYKAFDSKDKALAFLTDGIVD